MNRIIVVTMLVLLIPSGAMAHGHLWYDVTAHVPQFKKLVIYPVSYGQMGKFLRDDDEQSIFYQMNDYLDKKMARKLKFKTISLGCTIQENRDIRIDEEKYKVLYKEFPSERKRGEAVWNITAADGYLMPLIREDRVETYTSPQTTVSVQMRSWVEVRNGPQGNQTLNNRNWTVTHVIPTVQQHLRHMDVEYKIFDETGKSVLTFENNSHIHDISSVKAFTDLTDEFRKDMKDMVMKGNKGKKEGDKVVVAPVIPPDSIEWGSSVYNFIQFATVERMKKVKNIQPAYTEAEIDGAKYMIIGRVNRLSMNRQWVAPYAFTTNDVVSSKKTKWIDGGGNEREMTVTAYTTSIHDVYGHWQYTGNVQAELMFVNKKTGELIAKYVGEERDDKTSDAYLHLVEGFYKEVKKKLNL